MQSTVNEAETCGCSVTEGLPEAHLLNYQTLAGWEIDLGSALFEEPPVAVTEPLDGTFARVIADFQTEPESTFQGLRYAVRENHRTMLRRICDRYGHWKLAAIDTRDLKAWYRDWSAGGKVASGHAFIGQLRTLLTHGVLLLPDGPEREQCRRIKELLSGMKFPQPAPREERLTAEQAVAIRAAAHEHFGWPSIALAQAFQFELMLRQKDCIGEWVPEDEPGESDVRAGGEKWLRGVRWSEVDENMILRHVTSKRQKPIVVDLRQCPMVAEELELCRQSRWRAQNRPQYGQPSRRHHRGAGFRRGSGSGSAGRHPQQHRYDAKIRPRRSAQAAVAGARSSAQKSQEGRRITMAIKYYCDGCDKEVFHDLIRKISVSVKKNGEVSASGGAYELCDGCADHLVRDSNPHNWARCAPMIKRSA